MLLLLHFYVLKQLGRKITKNRNLDKNRNINQIGTLGIDIISNRQLSESSHPYYIGIDVRLLFGAVCSPSSTTSPVQTLITSHC